MLKRILPFLLIVLSLASTGSAWAYEIIGQPSIFWREGEWQVYKDGHWIPYAESKARPASAPAQAETLEVPVATPTPLTDTNSYPYYYDGGYSYAVPLWGGFRGHRHGLHRKIGQTHTPQNLNNRSIGNIGRTTIGIGQPTIGIGQPTIGIGQPTIGIGQPTIRIGPQSGIVGQQHNR